MMFKFQKTFKVRNFLLSMLQTINISSKGQIAIPKKFRDKLGLSKQTQVYLLEKDGKLLIGKVDDLAKNIDWPDSAMLAASSLKDIWDNETEEKVWSQYK